MLVRHIGPITIVVSHRKKVVEFRLHRASRPLPDSALDKIKRYALNQVDDYLQAGYSLRDEVEARASQEV